MKTFFAAIQWMAFIIASSIVAPIAVASLFGLSGEDASNFVQRSVFILGLAGLLQIVMGHKLPVNEGPAGLWWGVFALYAVMIIPASNIGLPNTKSSGNEKNSLV